MLCKKGCAILLKSRRNDYFMSNDKIIFQKNDKAESITLASFQKFDRLDHAF